MAMQQCPKGHLYDNAKNPTCPFCGGMPQQPPMPAGAGAIPRTAPVFNAPPAGAGEIPKTAPVGGFVAPTPGVSGHVPPTQPVSPAGNKTQIVNPVNTAEVIPVTGWLVAVDGPKKGADFRLHHQSNRIGRGEGTDINLEFDTEISRGVDIIVTYDHKNNKFFLSPNASKNNIYHNGNLLLMPVELKDYDVIEIGKNKFAFRSFCSADFNWEK